MRPTLKVQGSACSVIGMQGMASGRCADPSLQ